MKTIDLLLPNHSDGTSVYRGMGPMNALAKDRADIACRLISTADWTSAQGAHLLIAQRPYTDQHLNICMMYRANGAKLILDYDDYLFGVPESNRAYDIYMKPGVHKNMLVMMALADAVMVSTPALASMLELEMARRNLRPANFVVVPNAHNDLVFGPIHHSVTKRPEAPIAMWRGSDTHLEDVLTHIPGLKYVFENTPKETFFAFFGMRPWFTRGILDPKRRIHIGAHDPTEYTIALRDIAAHVVHVPLDSCEFNLCKSNIAWIEATHSGSVVVAPDWPEWKRPGVICYQPNDNESFARAMMYALGLSEEGRMSMVDDSRRFIEQHLLLSKVNLQRESVIDAVLKGDLRAEPSALAGRSSTATAVDQHIRQTLTEWGSLQD